MDLSLRVYLRGWRSLYLHDVCCPNELPSTLSAYKTQQFRWLSGPMQARARRALGRVCAVCVCVCCWGCC
jgi:cellulose synthase/poly-beta-1,6-N-acetylglucosamine synthase-like glycosyltransferase